MTSQTSEKKIKSQKQKKIKPIETEETIDEIKKPTTKITEDINETLLEVNSQDNKDEVMADVEQKLQEEKKQYVFQRMENVDTSKGLSSEEAANRILHHYNNVNDIKTTKTGWQIVRDNVFTFFNMLYLVIAVLIVIAKQYSNLTFLVIVILNTALSIYQEFKEDRGKIKLNFFTSCYCYS